MNFALANLKSASVEGWKRWSLTCEKGVEAWRFVFLEIVGGTGGIYPLVK